MVLTDPSCMEASNQKCKRLISQLKTRYEYKELLKRLLVD